ncbi:Ig-like domain repeat protein [Nakamurella antarctica]|nr:Ig-like domain repeat protein [Nakamurella antarctica]
MTGPESSVFGKDLAVSFSLSAGSTPIPDAAVTVQVAGASQVIRTDAAGTGTATIAAAQVAPGPAAVTLTYDGDGAHPSASTSASLDVLPAAATLVLAASPSDAAATSVSAALSTNSGIDAAGAVTFDIDGVTSEPVAVSANQASFALPTSLALGAHTVTASYLPTAPDQVGPTTAASTVSIAQVSTGVTGSATKDAVRYGDQASFTIAVSAAAEADLTGAVKVTDGEQVVAEGTTNPQGQASLQFLNRFDPGSKDLTVTFAGSDRVGASQSQLTLVTSSTNVDISIVKPTLLPDGSGTVTVSIIGTPDKPTGQVTATLDGIEVANGEVDAAGKIGFTVSAVAAGDHQILVNYSGDKRFQANTAKATLSVTPPVVNPNEAGAASLAAANPCPTTAAACVDLTNELAWLQTGGEITYGPVDMTSGKAGHRTGTGTFKVYWLDKHHKSSIYNGAAMPNSVFFDGGIAFHQGSLSVQSAGCIHLSSSASETFFNALHLGDSVFVFGTPPY